MLSAVISRKVYRKGIKFKRNAYVCQSAYVERKNTFQRKKYHIQREKNNIFHKNLKGFTK